MNGFKKALISIFALVLIALCAFVLLIIAFVPSAALAKTLAIVLPLCIIAGAVIALRWPDKTFCSFCKSAYRCNRSLVLSGTAYELSRFFYDELKR